MIQPYPVIFKDDGVIPNSRHALLLYRGVLDLEGGDPASFGLGDLGYGDPSLPFILGSWLQKFWRMPIGLV
jgi:hypothetical protein